MRVSARPRRASAMSGSGRNGAHRRTAVATSHSTEPGPARSKSISATASPSRNTTLSRFGSLWLTIPSTYSGGTGSIQMYGVGSNPATAWWYRRSNRGTLASATSVIDQAGYGGATVSPGRYDNISRPYASMPRNRGAPSNPTDSRWSRRARTAGVDGRAGRPTVSPIRTTRPRFAVPPCSCASGIVDQGTRQGGVRHQPIDQPATDGGLHCGQFRHPVRYRDHLVDRPPLAG